MSMNGQQIYENFSSAPGPDGLASAQEKLNRIKAEYDDLADQIMKVAASMEEGWQGEASGAAQRGAGPLAVEHAAASAEMNTGQDLLRRQIDSFDFARNSVQPVPPAPDKPSTMENIFTLGSAGNRYDEQVAARQAAEQQNVETMKLWTNHSSYNERMMPTSYGSILSSPAKITMDTGGTPGAVGTGSVAGSYANGPSGDTGVTSASVYAPPAGSGPAWSAPAGPGGSVSTPPAASTSPAASAPPAAATPPAASTSPGGSTSPSGYAPGTGTAGGDYPGGTTGDSRRRRSGTTGGVAPVGGFDSGRTGGTTGRGIDGPNATGGTAGRPGSGSAAGRLLGGGTGSGTGGTAGPGAGQGLGAGRGTGAAAPGTSGTGGTAAAGSSTAAGGRGGMRGMPMGAGAAGRGNSEDEDHQRKYVMDDDEHFQLTEDGEKLTDPSTGMTATPPVLGERNT